MDEIKVCMQLLWDNNRLYVEIMVRKINCLHAYAGKNGIVTSDSVIKAMERTGKNLRT